MATYHILALDGGGIRGILTARLLERIETAALGFLAKADLIAGTSTGGILALGLAHGLTPTQLKDLYAKHASKIFDDSWLDDLKDLGGLSGAEYDNKELKRLLAATFGTAKLKDLKKRVLVPAFDLDHFDGPAPAGKVRMWKPKFFHNFPGVGSDGEQIVVDVALRTSAAPTYFPTYQGYIDGGVVANNPSVAALAQALDAATGGQQLADVRLLSIGTGLSPSFIAGQSHDWGFAQWAKPLVTLMIDGVMGVADYQCVKLLGSAYHRLAPVLSKAIGLDAADKTAELVKHADRAMLGAPVGWIQRQWM